MRLLTDVETGSRWFQDVLGLRSGHDEEVRRRFHGAGAVEYEMLMDGDVMVAQLHRWEAHDHPHLGDETDASRGDGVLLWFATDDFDGLLARIWLKAPKATVSLSLARAANLLCLDNT